ncbi:HNH endonuclease [Subtercola endophyticus]|nr:HNH endonuclease [Subtercola endophyticus]
MQVRRELHAEARADEDLLILAAAGAKAARGLESVQISATGEICDRSRAGLGSDRLCVKKGCRTACELLQRVTQLSSASVARLQRVASAVRGGATLSGSPLPPRFPVLAAAVESGTLGLDTATAIVSGLSVPTLRASDDAVRAAEHELVDAALGSSPECPVPATPDELRMQAAVWRTLIDPDGVEPDEERAMKHRSLSLGRATSSGVPLSGVLIPEAAARLQRLFDAYLSPVSRPVAFPFSGSASEGTQTEAGAVSDPRSRVQQQHDVFLAVLDCSARSAQTPSIGGAAPTVLVTVTQSDLDPGGTGPGDRSEPEIVADAHNDVGQGDETGADADPSADADPGDRIPLVSAAPGIGWIEGLELPVSMRTVRQMVCAGGVQKVLLDRAGRVLQLSTEQRCFTGWQRRAITLRDGGCIVPGCDIPASWCEIHHVTPHSDGGATHIDNGVLLCWFHHRTIEVSGWQIRMRGGAPQIKAPPWLDRRYRTWTTTTKSRVRLAERFRAEA